MRLSACVSVDKIEQAMQYERVFNTTYAASFADQVQTETPVQIFKFT